MFRRTKVCSAVLVAFGGTLALGAAPAFGQQTLDRVEITGSSIKRIDVEGALPVQIITARRHRAQRRDQHAATAAEHPAASSAGRYAPTPPAPAPRPTAWPTISLRGLGEERTLVLVNGRRLAILASAERCRGERQRHPAGRDRARRGA